jgi:hypothetical protein
MLKIRKEFVTKVTQADKLEQLFPMVQNAIELEHSTIPPYLTAMFSLKPGTEREIWQIIHSVVIEEMLHMTIAANILNALGGEPAIDKPGFVPEYPSELPMGIGGDLVVNLAKYSKDQVKDTFMRIEEPENPLVLKALLESAEPEYHTIGQFYRALQERIYELAPDVLAGNPKWQVTSSFFSSDLLFPILTKEDAIKAIAIIVEQGEGTSVSPIDLEGEIAHYYLFEELYRGRRLIRDDNAPHGYAFTGPAIPFDPGNVEPLYPNTKSIMFGQGSEERHRVDEFNAAYTSLLRGLHKTFNGYPEHLKNTLGLMYDVKLYGEKLCSLAFPGKAGYTIGPAFEYTTGNSHCPSARRTTSCGVKANCSF